jgi:BolA protein
LSVADEIRRRLGALQPERLELADESAAHAGHAGWRPGGETHWRVLIVAGRFAGLSTVARHRLVYQALGELMSHPIHALSISAYAPGEPGASVPASASAADGA